MKEKDIQEKIKDELSRIEEDALYSMKGHYNAAEFWRKCNYWLGGLGVLAASIASITSFSELDNIVKIAAILSAILTALATFFGCAEKAEKHQSSGNGFLKIKNKARATREITASLVTGSELEKITSNILEQKDELNSISLAIPRFSYKKAQCDIEKGYAKYNVDKQGE